LQNWKASFSVAWCFAADSVVLNYVSPTLCRLEALRSICAALSVHLTLLPKRDADAGPHDEGKHHSAKGRSKAGSRSSVPCAVLG
jgi:hypothetical protein